ncbi:MAG: hypothetical protein HZA31_07220 [Opitutae bacterium]|nr:hypothetical protein [Opitutae bacterium]
MSWQIAKRSSLVYVALAAVVLGVGAWQTVEHRRVRQAARQELINRGRDITSTLGVVVRSQRRFGLVISKERIESALQDLVRPDYLESIAILGATGEPIVSAGPAVDLTPEMLKERGEFWHHRTLTLMNLMDLGASQPEAGAHAPPALVLPDERLARVRRSPAGSRAAANAAKAGKAPAPATTTTAPAATAGASGTPPFGRPSWMSQEEYESVIQKQGMHSLVIVLSTEAMQRALQRDLLLRSLISLFALAAATLSVLAWRNFSKNAELQLRLIKAGEMNTHLKEMNLAAAGLAHETRNPLNLIRGMAQMITMQTQSAPQLRQHAEAIMEEADRVAAQLNEFINYSKPREAHPAPVELNRVAADVARTLVPDLEEKRIRLRLPEAPLRILADEPLLRQTLFNLLLNATQAVEAGGQIELAVAVTESGKATLEIRDDGPGVPAAQRTSIFKPYVTMRPKGVGLGLAIVQQIVSAHGWEIVCTENQPRGAIFRISQLKVAPAT